MLAVKAFEAFHNSRFALKTASEGPVTRTVTSTAGAVWK